MLKIYKSPDGYTFQYEEGAQPDGYVLVEAEKKAKAPANKAKKPINKSTKAATK